MRYGKDGRRVWSRRVVAAVAVLLAALALVVTAPAGAQTYVVTTIDDGGPGSLREAVLNANASPGPDTITFNLGSLAPQPPGTTFRIALATRLPTITDPVVIDGTTQPSFVPGGPPVVVVEGEPDAVDLLFDGFVVATGGAGSTIRGLALVGFLDAVELEATSSVTVDGNLIGIRPTGTAGPNVTGIRLSAGSTGNTVSANTISGNAGDGVVLDQAGGNRLVSNRIGTDRDGSAAVPNADAGVVVNGPGAGANVIGEAGAGNVISGNGQSGIVTEDASAEPATANQISGNLIGTDASGTAALGNGRLGISVAQSIEVVAGNVISGNLGGGIHADAFGLAGFVVRGNRIGTNAAGTAVLANGLNGISLSGGTGHLVGGPGSGEGNLVSGNARGIDIDGAEGARIEGNLVGTDVTGTVALGNSDGGILVADGLGYVVGGPGAAGNVVSANTGFGVFVFCQVQEPLPVSARVEGNRVGTDRAGTSALPNGGAGVVVSLCASDVSVVGNQVSGNAGAGFVGGAIGLDITGNLIGTDAAGAAPLGNDGAGIELSGSGTVVGGIGPGEANTVAFNEGAGVLVTAGTAHSVRGNSIHSNGGLGIDLADDGEGVTPNDPGDADQGPNLLQNFPVLTSAVAGPPAQVAGTFAGAPSATFTVDLYASVACDPSGFGEGQAYLGATAVTTDAAGAGSFSTSVAAGAGQFVTATATDSAGNTSEFSACIALVAPPPGISVASVSVDEGAGVATVTVSTTAPATDPVSVTLTTSNGTATAVTVVIPAGQTSATVGIPVVDDALDEADETFTVTLSNPLGGVLGVAQATVTIVDDDPLPALRVGDAVVVEGDAGTVALSFPVSLSAASGRPVSVTAATSDGTATAGVDYVAASATVVIPAGAQSAAFVVTVVGDTAVEPDETLNVTLSAPVNAVLADASALGVIANDDGAPPANVTTTSTTTTTAPPAGQGSTSTTSTTRPETRIIEITDPTTTTVATVAPEVVVTTVAPPLAPATTAAPSTPPSTTPSTTTPATTTSPTSTSTTSTSLGLPATTAPPATGVPTTTTTAPAPAGRSTLTAVAPDGTAGGPPGVGLEVAGAGYLDCNAVYFFFDGVRVGSGRPDASGAVAVRGLSVPGDAELGDRRVTSACRSSGNPLRAEAPFAVTDAPVHRPAFLTAIPQPRHVSTGAADLATSAIVAAGLLLLLAFPSQLFNATFTENYDEIRGWFGLPRRVFDAVGRTRQTVAFASFALVGGFIYSLLSPDFGLNQGSLALLAGMTVAVAVVSVGFCLPSALYMRRNHGEWGSISVLPASLLVGLACVALSRLMNFQPGYLYGVLAGIVFARALREREQGRLSAVAALFMLGVSVLAWVARVPVSAAASEPGVSVWLVALESCLGAIFLLGLESIVVGLLPMRFLDGGRVREWSGAAWAVLFVTGLFALVHVLLSPGSGYVGHTSGEVTIAVVVLYVAFGAVSVAFWAYFRYRPERWVPKRAR
jgi:parallel beta-helix repeat protein